MTGGRCRWFYGCQEPASADLDHPTLGWVPICDGHLQWMKDDPAPPKFVPPLVAASLDRRARPTD